MEVSKFLNIYGARMNVEFERLKNKVAAAVSTISYLQGKHAEKDAKIAELEAKIAAMTPQAPAPDVTDADYAALSKAIDDVVIQTPAPAVVVVAGPNTAPETTTPAEPAAPAAVDYPGSDHPTKA